MAEASPLKNKSTIIIIIIIMIKKLPNAGGIVIAVLFR